MIMEKNVNGQEPAWQPAWQHHKECNIDDYFVLRKLFWLASTLAYSPLAAIAMQIVLFLISKLLFNHRFSLKPKLSQHHNWHMLCLLCGLTPAKWWAKLTPSAGGNILVTKLIIIFSTLHTGCTSINFFLCLIGIQRQRQFCGPGGSGDLSSH